MSVCFTPYIHDTERDRWMLPHSGLPDQDKFELQVCNANAVDILLALGLEPASYGDLIAIDAFSAIVTAALRRHLGKRSPALPPITPERVAEAVERGQCSLDNPGFCVKCGTDAEGVEPDARKYECEACGEPGVYGAEELLIHLAL